MGAAIFTAVLGAVIIGFFSWTNHNGQKRDRERDWS